MTGNYQHATGRLVQGDVFAPQTKNMNGGPLTNLKGEPKVQYFIGVAVAKTDPGLPAIQAALMAEAQAGFPGSEFNLPDFAWKTLDGDVAPNNTKPGFAGCIVFRFTSGFAVSACTANGAAQITDPEAIKRGYYVRVVFEAKANGNRTKPGLYLNHRVVELIGYGEIIQSGPDAAALLAQAGAAVLPAGASSTPVASGAPMQPPVGGPAAGGMPGTAPVVAPVIAAAVPATAQTVVVAPVGGPAAGGMPGTPGVPAGVTPPAAPAPDFLTPPVLSAKANGVSYQQFIDSGWTDQQLRENGYM